MRKERERMIVLPMSASDEDPGLDINTDPAQQLDALLNQMDPPGDSEPPAQQDPPAEPPQTTPPPATPSQEDKTNYAFGQMRQQISQLSNLLGSIAKANGIEYKDEKDLLSKLNDDAISKMAQRQNVPVELLKEVEALRADSNAFKQQQLRNQASVGFQNIMTDYGLTQDELKAFALELDQQGKNPFNTPIDLVAEYKVMHFEDIMNKKVEAAVQAALGKVGQSSQHVTTPNTLQGPGAGGTDDNKITTVSGLADLLKDVK